MSLVFVSRDERTHNLFRASWLSAADAFGLEVILLFRKGNGFFKFLVSLLKAKLFRHNIFVFGVAESLALSLFRPNLVIITGLGRLLMPKKKWRKFIFKLLRLMYQNTPIVTLNKTDLRLFSSLGFKKCYFINGEGVDIDYVQNLTKIDNLDIDINKINFLYAGRLLRSKNVQIILKYFNDFFDNSSKDTLCHLNLVGDDDFGNSDAVDKSLIDTIREKHHANVSFLGYREDIRPLMRDSNVYISLSQREGLPFSVVEALALGCNCILSDVPGHKEFRHLKQVTLVNNISDFDVAVRKALIKKKDASIPDLSMFSKKIISDEIIKIMKENEFCLIN